MTVTHKITNMELTGRGRPYQIHAKQGDTNTRVVEISLYANNTPFQPPVGTKFVVRFRKQDGTSGMYDTMPDGTTPAATAEANLLTVNLAPQMLTCPGKVQCDVALVNGTDVLATFDFWLIVDPSPSEGTDTGSQNYYRVQTLDELNAVLDSFEQEILTKSGGQPVPVTSASEMVDTGTIYLYLGNEAGYAYGYIYVYQNGAWESTELYGRGQDGKSAYAYAQDGGYTGTEAEFSAKLSEEIPTELPNPAALTFTGAVTGTYDGSNPLTVEIPSGGAVSDEQVNSAVSAWLTEHPEATTTVQDGSVSEKKTTFFTKSFVELIGEMEVGFQDNSASGYHKKTFAVEPGKTYILNGGQWFTYYDSNMTDISGAADWTFVNSGLSIPSTDGKQYVNKILTVPEGSKLRYIRITVQDGGMTDSYPSCYEGPTNIGLIPRGSSLTTFDYANNKKVQNAFEVYSGENLIDASQCTLNSGNIYYSQLIPVQPGEKYYKAYKPGGLELFNYYGQGFPYKWTAGVDWFPSTGTVVTGRNDGVYIIPENAYYARTGCTMTDGAVNEWFVKSPKIITSVQVGKPFIASDAERNTVKEYLDGQHLVGLKLCCLGDSVTNQSQYGSAIADKYNMTNIAGGTDGASYTSATGLNSNQIAYNKVNSLDADTDVVVLMFGTNDISNSRTIGSFTDNDLTTLYGALRKTYDLLTTKFSGKRIGVVTSPQRNFNTVPYDTWKQYNDVIKKMAMLYKIPVLDGEYAGLVYGLANDYSHFTDDVHPASAGAASLAYNIGKFIESLPIYQRDGE